MDDLISRQAAIDALEEPPKVPDTWSDESAIGEREQWEKDVKALNSLPSAQPKKGKWIRGKEIAREYLGGETIHIEYKDYHCSECGYTVANIRWNVDGELVDRYCTSCGAQMEVEKDE